MSKYIKYTCYVTNLVDANVYRDAFKYLKIWNKLKKIKSKEIMFCHRKCRHKNRLASGLVSHCLAYIFKVSRTFCKRLLSFFFFIVKTENVPFIFRTYSF